MKYFLLFLIVLAILMYPLGVIFAINTLVPTLSISYGFLQYISVVILNVPLFASLKTLLKVSAVAKFYQLFKKNLKEN